MIRIKTILIWLFVSLSLSSIAFFKIGMAEFTLFHALVLVLTGCLCFICLKSQRLVIKYPPYFWAGCLFLCAVNVYHIHTVKVTSFIYSLIILLELLLIFNVIKRLETSDIRRICKIIIALYFINILISSVFIFFGFLPKGLLGSIFQIYDFDHRIRPYGFSVEPSYAAITLVFTLYVFFRCDNFAYVKSELKWYILATVTILLTGSSYGYLLLGMLLIYFTLRSHVILIHISNILKHNVFTMKEMVFAFAFAFVLVILAVGTLDLKENKSVGRLVSLYTSFTESDAEEGLADKITNVQYVDGSASMRLVPSIYLIRNFKESDLPVVLFGRGAGQATPFFSALYEGNITLLGFLPVFVYNYGIVGTVLFFLLFFSMFPRQKFLLAILFFLVLFNADFNTQLFLFVLFCIMACKQIETNSQSILKATEHA